MFELIVTSVLGATLFSGAAIAAVSAWTHGLASPQKNTNPALPPSAPVRMIVGPPVQAAIEAPRAPLPPEIREELDQTQGWWDKQFHSAMKQSGAPVSYREDGDVFEEYTFTGAVAVRYEVPGVEVLSGCSCKECTSTMDRVLGEIVIEMDDHD